ncbi:MAG: hypothetical protein HUU50_07715 [Candidatus Brocadiae bacterium]|nr:hypothetical protein [Candidatus Brocadiia bacterium]
MQLGLDMFPTTHWSLILNKEEKNRQKCLEELANLYWKPIYKILRLSGYQDGEAKDYTQELFLKILTNPEILDKANPAKGRFRCFLLGILQNLQRDNWRRQNTQRRHPNNSMMISISFSSDNVLEIEDNKILNSLFQEKWEEIFNQEWLLALREQTIKQLQSEYVKDFPDRNLALIAFQKHVFEKAKIEDISMQINKDSSWVIDRIHKVKEKYMLFLKNNILNTLEKEEYIELEIRELMLYSQKM